MALEAISAGAPVLLSDILPNKDIEAPEDSYFPVGDTSALSEKIASLDSLNLDLDQSAFLYEFNWDRIAENTISLIKMIGKEGDNR